jgi:ATP:ADP antiporter, AAA family
LKNKLPISQFLKVRESEKKLVAKLFVFQFFQGAAIALFLTASITIFLTAYPASELPFVYIISALLLWGFSYLYNQLEHKLSTKKLIYTVLIFNSIAILLFRVFIHTEYNWFLYLMLAFYNLLYLLNNLEFWGLVALLFDVRQSKRLFAIVSGGDLPAKLIGYLIAALLVPIFGTENLLWIAFSCLLISFLIFLLISTSQEFKKINPTNHDHHHPAKEQHHFATEKINTIIASISNNKLIRTLSFLSFFSFCFYLIASFVFYGFVKKQFHTDKNMAGFFAIFLASSRGLTLIVKLVFTNRLLDKLGLKKAMLITPVFLLVLSCISYIYSAETSNLATFYLFGIMAISVDVLKSSIQSPVMLATLQPLPAHQRLRGHTLIKGLMDPFAFFITGFVLLFLMDAAHNINFETLSLMLMILTALWILFSFFVDKHYVHLLTNSIRKRNLSERDISITDTESLHILLKKMETANEKEALTILHLADSQDIDHSMFFESALKHPSLLVRQHAIQCINVKGHKVLLPVLKQMMHSEEDPSQLADIISTVTSLDKTEDMSDFFDHNDQAVINAAVIAIINNPNDSQKKDAVPYLNSLLNSTDEEKIFHALSILKKLHSTQSYNNYILDFLDRDNQKISNAALELIAITGNTDLIDAVLFKFVHAKNDSIYLNALFKSGKVCLPLLEIYLQSNDSLDSKRKKIYKLISKLDGLESVILLEKSLNLFPQDADSILASLHNLNFTCKKDNAFYRKLLLEYLNISILIIFQIKYLRNKTEIYSLVIRALDIELANLKEKCLYIFSFMYDKNKIRKAIAGFDLNTKESTANAFELIEMTVDKEIAMTFCIIHEPTDLIYKVNSLKKNIQEKVLNETDVITSILQDQTYTYNDWTKACMLYSLQKKPSLISENLYSPFQISKSLLLSETSNFIATFNKEKQQLN